MTRFLHMVGFLFWSAGLGPSEPLQEQMAAMTLYSTSKRRTHATPQSRARAGDTAGPLTQEIETHGRTAV